MAILNFNFNEKKEPPKEQEKGTGMVNYCRTGGMMSTCGVNPGEKWVNHKECKFGVKSTTMDRCMHFTFGEFNQTS